MVHSPTNHPHHPHKDTDIQIRRSTNGDVERERDLEIEMRAARRTPLHGHPGPREQCTETQRHSESGTSRAISGDGPF